MTKIILGLLLMVSSHSAWACISSWEKGQVLEPTQIMREQGNIEIFDRDVLVIDESLFKIQAAYPTRDRSATLLEEIGGEDKVYYKVINEGTIVLKTNDGRTIELKTKFKPRLRCG